jgi:copper transport protein
MGSEFLITPKWMRNKLLFILSLLLAFGVFLPVSSVEAHSSLQKTYPQADEPLDKPPTKVEIWFEDPVVIHSKSIKVKNEKGNELQRGQPFVDSKDRSHIIVFLEENLSPGLYTVTFDVIALDGYVVRDQFKFIINEPSVSTGIKPELRLEKASPGDGNIIETSPQQIDLWFNQPAEITALGLFNKNDTFLTQEPYSDPEDPRHVIIKLNEELSPGTYQVSWFASPVDKTGRVIAADVQGIYYFAVEDLSTLVSGQDSAAFRWFSSSLGIKHIAHWFAFIGLLTLLGGSWFSHGIAKGEGNYLRWRRISGILYGISVIGLIFLLIQRRLELSNLSLSDYIALQFAWIPALQILLVTVSQWLTKGKFRILLGAASVLLWPFASGHTTYPRYGGYIAIGMDMLHLLAVSIWMGGLLALILMLPREKSSEWLKQAGTDYSKWAFWSMITIILTGIGMTLQFVPSFTWGSLMVSDWGKALVLKAILATVILMLAFWQRRSLQQLPAKAIDLFVRRGRMELIYGVLILFAAAILIESKPSAADQGVYPKTMVKEDMEVAVSISPFRMGSNDIMIQFRNHPDLEQVKVIFYMPPEWKKENKAFSLGNGNYKVTGNFLHASGTLYMEVEAWRPNGEKVVFPFRVVVPGEMRLYE